MKKYTGILLILVIISVISCGCSKKPLLNSRAVPVDTIILKNTSVIDSQTYQGNLISRNSVNLKPQVSGQISKILVKSGDKVQNSIIYLIFKYLFDENCFFINYS